MLSGEHEGIIPALPKIEFRFSHPDPAFRFLVELPADWRETTPQSVWDSLATTLACFAPPSGDLQLSIALARKEVEMLPADLARLTLHSLGAELLSLVPAEHGCTTLSAHPLSAGQRRTYWLLIADRCWLITFIAPPSALHAHGETIQNIVSSFAISSQATSAALHPTFCSPTQFPFRFELLPGWERRGRIRRSGDICQSSFAGPAGVLSVVWTDQPRRDLWQAISLPPPGVVRHLPPSKDFSSRSILTADSWLGLAFSAPDGSLLIAATELDTPANSLAAAAARAALQLAAATTARFVPETPEFYARLSASLSAAGPRWFAIVNEDFGAQLKDVSIATEHLTITQTGILLAEFHPASGLLPRLWGRQCMVLATASCSLLELAHHWRVLLLLHDGDRLVTFPAHRPDLLAGFLSSASPDSRQAFLGPAAEIWIEAALGKQVLRISGTDCVNFPV